MFTSRQLLHKAHPLQPLLRFHRLQFTFPLGKKGIQILREKRKIKVRGIWTRWQKTADGQRANTRLSSLLGLWYRSEASDASRAPLQTCAPASTRGSLPTPPCWSRDVSLCVGYSPQEPWSCSHPVRTRVHPLMPTGFQE